MAEFTSRAPALRAAIRMARRDAWRNRGRSFLIALMVALPVLSASAASVVYRSDQRDPQDIVLADLGNQAQARISYQNWMRSGLGDKKDSTLPKQVTDDRLRAALQARISNRDQLVSNVTMYVSHGLRSGDHFVTAEVREIDYQATGLKGLIEQHSGRAPKSQGEVVISEALARKSNLAIGGKLRFTPTRQAVQQNLTVVGVVNGASLLKNDAVIGAPGALIPAEIVEYRGMGFNGKAQIDWLVTGPDPVTRDQVRAIAKIGGEVTSRSVLLDPPDADQGSSAAEYLQSVKTPTVGIVVVVIGLVLLQIALLAGPAIAVGARRNQRGLAIMASTGAERRHLRAVVLATSGVIGLVASLIAAVLGAIVGAVIVLLVMRYGDRAVIRVDVHPLDLLGFVVVGALTAIAAALIPARQAARLDVVAALTGSRGQLASRLRVPLVGLSITAIGVVLAYLLSGQHRQFLSVAALALTEIGLIAATGAVLSLVARAAVRLPFPLRFALRDAARQRSRTVPAVAAVLAAIAGATCALVFVASQAAQDERQYTPEAKIGTTLVRLQPDAEDIDSHPVDRDRVEAGLRRTLPVAGLSTYRRIVQSPGASYTDLEMIRAPQNRCPVGDVRGEFTEDQARVFRTDPRCMSGTQEQWYSGPSNIFDDGSAFPLLAGVNDAKAVGALRAGRVVVNDPLLLWPDGTVHVAVIKGDEREEDADDSDPPTIALPATVITTPLQMNLPVYSLSAAKALGVHVAVQDVVVATTRMPTQEEEQRAALAVEEAGGGHVMVERGYQDAYGLGLLALVIAAAVVGLGGTFTAVGLAAAESRADVATLAAVGASPGVRRKLAASQAGVIAGLGSVLGVFSGVMAGWVLVRLQQPTGDHSFVSWGLDDESATIWQLVLPWAHLLTVGVGIPLLAVGVGYLTTRSRLPLVRRIGQ
ncbi:MAG TPA: FtsX-like permease family protein [Kineosporiaceae bacterium]|nr:FtsX-like permease family protein [Kineosporiaceae bacterium]